MSDSGVSDAAGSGGGSSPFSLPHLTLAWPGISGISFENGPNLCPFRPQMMKTLTWGFWWVSLGGLSRGE